MSIKSRVLDGLNLEQSADGGPRLGDIWSIISGGGPALVQAPASESTQSPAGAFDTGTGSISLASLDVAVLENFNTLSNTAGSTTNTTLPTGWYITEGGGGAR